MDFKLSEEHEMLRKMVRDFAENEIRPHVRKYDESAEFPRELFKKAAELGLAGVTYEEKYGGSGMDNLSYVIIIEELSRVDPSMGVIISVNNSLTCDPINDFGTEEQKKKYLTPLAKGEKLGCIALTEPGAGSDAGNVSTTAVKDGDYYIVNGTKHFITNGNSADIAILFARTDKTKKHKGISAFIVERDFPGYRVVKTEEKMGIRCSGSSEIVFEDMKVPKENLLGEEGMGFKIAMHTLDGGRIGIAAQALGIAQGAFEEAIKFAKERVQFEQPIINFQAIQFKLADMATQIEAARLMTYKAAWLKDKGERVTKLSAMAKMYASEVAHFVCHQAVQICGGYGFIKEYPVEKFYRDQRITEIYEGTNEIQRIVISRQVLKEFE